MNFAILINIIQLLFFRLLTGMSVKTMSDLKEAIQILHSKGPKTVAVSSTDINDKLTSIKSTSAGK